MKIFDEDEMKFKSIKPGWSKEDLLKQDGIFFLKDVSKVLEFDPNKVKKQVRELIKNKKDPWKEIGSKRIFNSWYCRMAIFGDFYRQHLVSKVTRVAPDWDGNVLLKQKGTFLLTEVCELIPFTTHQMRHQAKRNPNSREEYGIWKCPEMNVFLVNMEVFGPWVVKLWAGK